MSPVSVPGAVNTLGNKMDVVLALLELTVEVGRQIKIIPQLTGPRFKLRSAGHENPRFEPSPEVSSSASSAPISLVTCSNVFEVGVPSWERRLNYSYLLTNK